MEAEQFKELSTQPLWAPMKHAGLQQEGQESRMLCLPDFQALFPGWRWALSNKPRHKGLPLQVHGIFLY